MTTKPDNSRTFTATILGATGLIGSQLLKLIQQDDYFTNVRIVSRRPVSLQSSKVDIKVIDFSDVQQFKNAISGSDVVFCAVGTTQKKAGGDEEAYKKVDFDIPVNAARFSAESGCNRFLLVSSVGADSSSTNFYTRLKGEVEDAVRSTGIYSISVFRPSILLGERNESRPGETIAKVIMTTISFLLPSRIKPVKATDVAAAMVAAAKKGTVGFKLYKYREIMKLSATNKRVI